MTQKTVVNDYRVYVQGSYGDPVLIGSFFKKVWNGGDKIIKRPPREGFQFSLPKDPVTGKISWRWKRRPGLPKPKRFYCEDHPYSMTLQIYHEDGLSNYVFKDPPHPPDPAVFCSFKLARGGIDPNDTLWTANEQLALIGKLRTKVAGSDFNLGVFLGEGHKALDMIASNATRIYQAFRAVKRGNLPEATKWLTGVHTGTGSKPNKARKTPANQWLELQYGWLPLLQDVHSGAEFLAHHLEVPIELRVVARHKVESYPRSPGNTERFDFGWRWSSGQIIYRRKEVNVPALVGLMDPLSVAWELVPYSFVLDWFLPIGDWLAARGLSQSMTGSFVTTRRFSTYGESPYDTTGHYSWESRYSEMYKSLTRSISTELDVPLPKIKPLKEAFSWKRATNALALLAQKDLRK